MHGTPIVYHSDKVCRVISYFSYSLFQIFGCTGSIKDIVQTITWMLLAAYHTYDPRCYHLYYKCSLFFNKFISCLFHCTVTFSVSCFGFSKPSDS